MEIKEEQFDAIAYIFEINNGNTLGAYENQIIEDSGLRDIPASELAEAILGNLNEKHSGNTAYRLSAYWALSKRFDKNLLAFFQKSLAAELQIEGIPAVFQLLIALDNLNEPVFGKYRNGSFSGDDVESNCQDAKNYLAKYT